MFAKMRTVWIYISLALIAKHSSAEVTKIVYTPNPATVTEGGTIEFTCTGTCTNSTCSPNPLKQTVKNIRRNNGTFSCTIIDTGDNHVKTEKIPIEVYYGPDSEGAGIFHNKTSITELRVIEGEYFGKYDVECRRGACSNCELAWTGDLPVPNVEKTDNKLSLFAANLTFKSTYSGSFTCTATNLNSGAKWTKIMKLIVQYAPEVSMAYSISTRTLTCKAKGVPTTYTFSNFIHQTDTGTKIREIRPTVTNDVAKIVFNRPNYQDTGRYTCVAANGIQSFGNNISYTSKSREFRDEPLIVNQETIRTFNVSKGDFLAIDLLVYSIPSQFLLHVADSQGFDIQTNSQLEETTVHIDFYGVTVKPKGNRCVVNITEVLESYFNETLDLTVTNEMGTSTQSVLLYPEGAPDIPRNFSLTKKTHDMVAFQLVTGFFNGAPQTLVLEYRMPGTNDWNNGTLKEAGSEKNNRVVMYIHGLTPETMYEFRARSYNEYGISDYTETITEILEPTPLPVGVIVGSSVGFLVIIIIVIVVVVVCKRRKAPVTKGKPKHDYQNTELKGSIPFHSGFGNNFYSEHPPIPRDDVTGTFDDETNYENTQIGRAPKRMRSFPSNDSNKKESVIYQNTGLQTFSNQDDSEASKPNPDQGLAPYIELSGGPVVEEAYLDMNEARALAQPQTPGQASLDSTYLDMNQSKAMVEETRQAHVSTGYTTMKPSNQNSSTQNQQSTNAQPGHTANNSNIYSNMEFKSKDEKPTEDYENVLAKKNPPSRFTPGRNSIPEYIAPPPPIPLEEDNYVNLKMKP